MKYFKFLLTGILVILMALPAFAQRRKVKKDAKALLTSGRIALNSSPPRYEEALDYFNQVLEDHGPVPEAYFYKGNIFAEYATREYGLEKKIEYFTLMSLNHDSLTLACEDKDVKKKLKDKCDEFHAVVDSIRVFYWGDHYNSGVETISLMDDELIPNVSAAYDDESLEMAKQELKDAADTAMAFFRVANAVQSNDSRNYEGMALVYDRIKNFDSSLFYFKKASDLAPDNLNLVQSVAYSYIQIRDWQNAAIYFKKILESNPDDVNIMINLAVCHNNLRDYDSSFIYNKMVLSVDSTLASTHVDVGQYFLLKAQNYSDSIKHFKQESNKSESDRYQGLRDNSLDSCIQYFNNALIYEPDNSLALEQGAIAEMIRGLNDQACEKFGKLTQIEPGIMDFWVNYGDCLIRQQKFTEAVEPYEKALEIEPDDVKIWEVLESLYRSEKMTEKANQAAARIKELKGN